MQLKSQKTNVVTFIKSTNIISDVILSLWKFTGEAELYLVFTDLIKYHNSDNLENIIFKPRWNFLYSAENHTVMFKEEEFSHTRCSRMEKRWYRQASYWSEKQFISALYTLQNYYSFENIFKTMIGTFYSTKKTTTSWKREAIGVKALHLYAAFCLALNGYILC